MDTGVRAGLPARMSGREVTFTLRGGALLAVGVLAFATAYIADWPEMLIVACFCGIPPILAMAAVTVLRPGMTVVRSATPAVLSAGGAGTSVLTVRNTSRRRAQLGTLTDRLPWAPGHSPGLRTGAFDPGETRTIRYSFTPPTRGILELGPLLSTVSDPFGLARARYELGDSGRIIVAPCHVPLGSDAIDIASDSGSASLFDHRALAGEHDVMTRDYRPGDALRRVHWKASAHHGELMVREDEKRSHSEGVIVVDTSRRSYRDVASSFSSEGAESEHFEWALSCVASVRDHWVASGLHVSVVETAVAQLADAAHHDGFIESIARIRLSFQDAARLQLGDTAQDTQGVVVAVLDSPDSSTVSALCEQRALFTTASALLLGARQEHLISTLQNAGWTVHQVGASESVLQAWSALSGSANLFGREATGRVATGRGVVGGGASGGGVTVR